MAGCLRNLFRVNPILQNKTVTQNILLKGRKFLYTEQRLGIDGFLNSKSYTRNQFANVESSFREKMKHVCEDENAMIFTEDLKAMLHLAEKKPEDLELVMKMTKKFCAQNTELRFGTYVFGPIIMRMFYTLNEADLALSVINDPDLESMFNQFTTYQILMCLLYKNQKYAEIRSVYDKLQQKALHGVVHPRNMQMIALGACYKENTPETLKYALDIYKDTLSKGVTPMRKALVFLGLLAMEQNSPHIALEVVSTSRENLQYADTKCVRLLADVALDRYSDIIHILKTTLEADVHFKRDKYFIDVVEKMEEYARNRFDETNELPKLLKQLRFTDKILSKKITDFAEQHIDVQRDTVSMWNQENRYSQRRDRQARSTLRDFL